MYELYLCISSIRNLPSTSYPYLAMFLSRSSIFFIMIFCCMQGESSLEQELLLSSRLFSTPSIYSLYFTISEWYCVNYWFKSANRPDILWACSVKFLITSWCGKLWRWAIICSEFEMKLATSFEYNLECLTCCWLYDSTVNWSCFKIAPFLITSWAFPVNGLRSSDEFISSLSCKCFTSISLISWITCSFGNYFPLFEAINK